MDSFCEALVLRNKLGEEGASFGAENGVDAGACVLRDDGLYGPAVDACGECKTAHAHLFVGACLVDLFTQASYCGPTGTSCVLPTTIADAGDCTCLAVDGESVCTVTAAGRCLVEAKKHLSVAARTFSCAAWLQGRAEFLHQRVMDAPCASIKASLDFAFDEAADRFGKWTEYDNMRVRRIATVFNIERTLVHLHYNELSAAKKTLARATEYCGLVAELRGGMGKRTKYQEKPTPLLYLFVERQLRAADPKTFPGYPLPPESRFSEDSDFLDHPIFEEGLDSTLLSAEEQALLLARAQDKRQRSPHRDDILTEESIPIPDRVARDPVDWSVHCTALLMKSRAEANTHKTADRALGQLQALTDFLAPAEAEASARTTIMRESGNKDAESSASVGAAALEGIKIAAKVPTFARVARQHLVLWPSAGELKRELGKRYATMGSPGVAAQLFEETRMFDELILCLAAAGEKDRAERVAKDRLALGDDPELLCVLGDIIGDEKCYEQAWEMSGHHLARAQRSLGHACFGRQQWAAAIEHYRTALEINGLFSKSWFAMGCAAMQINDMNTALVAFSRVVSIDPDDGEAWCNIAAVHMQTGRAAEAHMALQEALRQKPDSWRIWQNYVLVCTSPKVRDYANAIYALGKLIDLIVAAGSGSNIPRSIDPRPLYTLMIAIIDDTPARNGVPSSRYARAFEQLIPRVENETDMCAPQWDIIATYTESQDPSSKLAIERRASHCHALEGSWPGNEKRWNAVSEAYNCLADDALRLRDTAYTARCVSVLQRAAPFHSETEAFKSLAKKVTMLEKIPK